MAGFSVESLERGILACEKNIITFEEAIKKENNTIEEYRFMIKTIKKKAQQPKIINIKAERQN